MKNTKILLIAALLGTVLAGCQKEADIQKPEEKPTVEKGWTLTIQVSKDTDTKALDYDGMNNKLSPYWEVGETVDVYLVGGDVVGTLEVESVALGVATLTGEIDAAGMVVGDILKLVTPGSGQAWDYSAQNGIAPDADFDFATSCLKVTALNTATQEIETENYDDPTADPTFTSEQSVYRLLFKIGDDPIDPKSFTMSATQNKLVLSRSFSGSDWTSAYGPISATPSATTSDHKYFLSVRNENTTATNNYKFEVVKADNALYEGSKDISKALANGKLYSATISLAQKTVSQGTPSETVTTAL